MPRELYRDSAAPTLDVGVRARLRRLDLGLEVTFCSLAVDPLTSRPLITDDGGVIRHPVWTVWSLGSDGVYRYVSEHQHFGHEQVARLESDLARAMAPRKIIRSLMERQLEGRQRGIAHAREERAYARKQNRRRINDLVVHGKRGVRAPKIVSYPGQTTRRTPTAEIPLTDREAGWESRHAEGN